MFDVIKCQLLTNIRIHPKQEKTIETDSLLIFSVYLSIPREISIIICWLGELGGIWEHSDTQADS